MDWDYAKCGWSGFQRQVKTQWGKLGDTDLRWIAGDRGRLEGRIQRRYALNRVDAAQQVESWSRAFDRGELSMNERYTDDGNRHE
jgi:uncharacterized protein YjbJ (UPF0337 family)